MAEEEDIPKDSFDRFGDDLSQLLLSYLASNERPKLESVCRQWQRVVYRGQTKLEMKDQLAVADSDQLATLLQKYTNIESVTIDFDNKAVNQHLGLIASHCPHLRSININRMSDYKSTAISRQTIDHFLSTFAARLHTFEAHIWHKDFESGVKQCLQLRQLTAYYDKEVSHDLLSVLTTHDQQEADKTFKHIHKVTLHCSMNRIDTIRPFVAIYGQQLRSIQVRIKDMHEWELKTVMTSLSQMSNLMSLTIYMINNTNELNVVFVNQLGTQLSRLGLKELSLQMTIEDKPFMRQLMRTVNQKFGHRLRRLKLWSFNYPTDYCLLSSELNRCIRLTHLEVFILGVKTIGDQFHSNICNHLPRLESLTIIGCVIRSSMFKALAKLPNLRIVDLSGPLKCGEGVVKKYANKCLKVTKFEVKGKNYL